MLAFGVEAQAEGLGGCLTLLVKHHLLTPHHHEAQLVGFIGDPVRVSRTQWAAHHRLTFFSTCLCFDLVGYVQWNDLCPSEHRLESHRDYRHSRISDYRALGPAKVVLDGKYTARVTHSGNFSMYAHLCASSVATDTCYSRPDVDPGTYVLSVTSRDYAFDQVR